jgi:DNA modification methylase
MAKAATKPAAKKSVEALKHGADKRKNIPTAEFQSVLEKEQQVPKKVRYPRNNDLDPQLVWRGKDEQDWSDLIIHAPPLYIQEKVQPKVLIDDLLRATKEHEHDSGEPTPDLFADFNGIPKGVEKTEFYQHDQNWSNRVILGDSLQVMASLAEREGLRGKVQCIYVDPPYGITFDSNFQWSTTSPDVKDGKASHITREPEQVKAFRDTWRDGIHSYLTYLRDRLTVARELLVDSGSIFVQIGDENVHRVRVVMDEVFGEKNCVTEILVKKKGSQKSSLLDPVNDFILWYSKSPRSTKDIKFHARIGRQKEIDASIAAKADFEYLYDKPYEDRRKVRVAGPFTVESLSPHRVLGVDENDELIDGHKEGGPEYGAKKSFPEMILENLKIAGVQQAHKEDRITFTALTPWPGDLVCAEGRYLEGETEKRAAIFIGPEFGTVQRADLVSATREAGDAGFDVLIACAFNYEAHTTEFTKLGRIPVLKARMNADLHMAEDLKNRGKGNLFVIFGEPDIDLIREKDGMLRVKVNGVDVFKPQTGEVISDNADGIACWFIDTDYNEESFFVRHAYFLGANDPYSALKTTLKAEIDPEACRV